MKDTERQDLVWSVERQIAALLAGLENQTGCHVEGIEIEDTEVTRAGSKSPEYSRRVVVHLRRQPGSHWQM